MRPSPDISRRRPGAGALSALVLLSLLMVSVDRLEATRPVVVTAAAGTQWTARAEAPAAPVRSLAGFRIAAPPAPPAPAPLGPPAQPLARLGLIDLPPPHLRLA